MNTIIEYKENDLYLKLYLLLGKIKEYKRKKKTYFDSVYGVPRGGISIATFIGAALSIPIILEFKGHPNTLIVDDIVDSGKTRKKYPSNCFACLDYKDRGDIELEKSILYVDKYIDSPWIKYPWEKNETEGEDTITRIIELVGENPLREGLKGTPSRVIKSYNELFKGYTQNPKDVFKTFKEDYSINELVLLRDIEMHSICEHHLLPFIGKAHIAYIPKGRIIGVSKLARLLEIYSRRMQIQERIGEQVTTAIMENLNPLGAACIIQASHLCMRMRGINKQNSTMITSSLKGVFLEKFEVREELLKIIKFRD